jgi:hypothetical protein
MITSLISTLRTKNIEPTAEELADALWFAIQIRPFVAPATAPSTDKISPVPQDKPALPPYTPDAPPTQNSSPSTETPIKTKKSETRPPSVPDTKPQPAESRSIYPRTAKQTGSQPIGSRPFRTPAATMLPGVLSLERALRPLMRRVASRTHYILNEAATVQQIAEQRIWLPVLQGAPERWFEVALVIDDSTSMEIWRPTIAEWRVLLERHGAFRNIQTWSLKSEAETGPVRLYAGVRASTPRELIDPLGRRVILVVSDCVSPLWYTSAMTQLLELWGKHNPVAIVQMLPHRLWAGSALGEATLVNLQATMPGLANAQLTVDEDDFWFDEDDERPTGMKVPIVTLEPDSLTVWARMVMGRGDAWAPGALFESSNTPLNTLSGRDLPTDSPPEKGPTAQQRVQQFYATASPMAQRLAGYFAAAPLLILPVMRLVQQVMLPESRQVQLAEVFLGGLLKRVSRQKTNPVAIEYDFHDGVRDLLLDSVLVPDAIDVLKEVSEYLNKRLGQSLDFRALLADPTATDGIVIDKENRPFAEIGAKVLRRLGGEYKALANKLDKFEQLPVEQALPKSRKEVLEKIAEDLLKADKSSQEIAKIVPFFEQYPESYLKGLNALLWRLITDNRLGLAYHIAQSVEKLYSKEQCAVPAMMLKALALSQLVHSSLGEVIAELQSDIPQIISFFQQKTTAQSDQTSYNLLGFALVLRPALFAPVTTGAKELLSQLSLSEAFQALNDLRHAIFEYTGLGLALTPDILKGVSEQARWSNSLEALQSEAEEWLLKNSREAHFRYPGRAFPVWKRWLKEDGYLGKMLTVVIKNDRDKQPQVEQTINAFSSAEKVEKLLHKTARERRARLVKLRLIDEFDNATKAELYNHVQNALKFAKKWLDLLQNEPQPVNRFIREQANKCRTKIISCLQQSQTQLQALLQQDSPRLELAASVAAAKRALQDLQALFDPQQTEKAAISWQYVLHAELLRLPRLTLDETWQRPAQLSHREFLASLINLLQTEQSIDWDKAFDEQCEACNHLATQRLIDFLKEAQRHKTPDELASLEKRRENNLMACRRSLEISIKETREKIERATVEGGLAETERLNWLSTLDKMVHAEILVFHPSFNAIRDIVEQLNTKKKQIQKLRYELQESATQIKPEDSQRIKAALDKGDVLIANEYLAMAKAGSPLPENENTRDAFSDFFPQFVDDLISVLGRDRKDSRQNIKDIENGKGFYPLDMRPVPSDQAKTAAEMLQAWLAVQHQMGNNIVEGLRKILEGIGFQNSELRLQYGSRTDRHRWFEMRVRPIRNRDICVIPTFGSIAQGYYRLLCLWERPSEDEILSLTARQPRDMPIIVFYFGRLTTKRRRDLAYLCREGRRTLLVVDETLIYFLCGERGLRLPILFQCAFPFTVVANPFTKTGSDVPVEMFFGRQRQRESIFDRFGTNLIYGGRQLGKTALLREVKRQSHNPDDGIIVLRIDLKAENIGMSRPPEEIWLVIAQALQQEGILSPSVRQPESMSTEIQTWLNVHPQRRILLLLDEADGFVFQEATDSGNPFQTLTRMKNLMESTECRFKVVFAAGSHKVQRTATPVCIGPMLGDGEEREARKLLTLPFFMLGYRFEPPDLPNRILGLTNYYPSLIQLFGWHLLEHLTDKNKAHFDARESPPYLIQAHHIDEVYQRQELRKAIIDRFNGTLNLDPRYRVIALQIALESLVRRQQGILDEGFEVEWVKTEALSLWSQGFKDQTYEAFRTLLDEMIGLGVLRKVGHLYDLRSPNVINLLGTQNEIEEALLDAVEEQPPLVYKAASFRRALPTDHWQRSPLTWQQESTLFAPQNDVAIIEQAQQALGEKPSIDIDMIEAFEMFSTQLEGLCEQIPAKEQALEAFSGQLDKLEAYLVKLSQQDAFDLEHIDYLLSRWYLSAYQPDTVEDINRVSQDIGRVFVEVAPLAEDYQGLSQQINEQIATLAGLSMKEQQHTFAQLTGINEQRAKLKQHILNQASPFQQTFDSETDYLTEWLTLSSELRQPALETPPVLVDTSADGNTQSNDSSVSEASEVGHSTAGDDLKNTPAIEKSEASKVGQSTATDDSKPALETPPVLADTSADEKTQSDDISAYKASKVGHSTATDDSKNTPATNKIGDTKPQTKPYKTEQEIATPKDKKIPVKEQVLPKSRIDVLDKIAEDLLKADKSSQELAKIVPFLEQYPESYLKGLNALVWRLITDNRLGLAYHIAQTVEKRYSKEQCAVPAMMLKALALSQLVHSSLGEVIVELQSDIPKITSFFQQKTAQSDQTSYNLLGFALVLRPALLAPVTTGANELLSQLALSEAFQALYDLRHAILEYTRLGLALTPDILKGVGEQARWSESLESLQSEAEEWLNNSREAHFRYDRTTRVWRRWLNEEGDLGKMLTAVIQHDRDKQPQVEQIIDAFSSADKVHQLLHRTDREIRGRRADVRAIDNAARTAVYRHVQNALQFAQDWLDLLQNEPQQVNRFIHEQANNCRTKIISYLHQSQTQLQAFLQQHSPRLELAASVATANRALEDLQALFDPQQTEKTAISWQHVLHAELLRIPRLTLDETWQRPAHLSHREFLASLLNLLQTEQSIDWDKAFDEQCEAGNHLATQRIINFLKEAQRHKRLMN